MMRLASTLVAAAFLAGSAATAFAADTTRPATPSARQPASSATGAPQAAHHRHMAVAHHHGVSNAAGDRMTAALNLLEANGYGGFTNFKQDGNNFSATVSQGGQQFNVVVDPGTGQVTRQG